jgi:hypothetical protein
MCFDVAPAEADAVKRRLCRGGIPAIACLDGRTATILVPAGATPGAVAAALRGAR